MSTPTPMYLIKISRKEKFLDWLFKRYTCQYCHKACYKHLAYSDDEELGLESACTAVMWRCASCQAQYNTNWDKEINSIYLETHLNNKRYLVYLNPRTNSTWISTYDNHDIIMNFNYLLPITPSNIRQKLQTILTFL